MTWNPFKRKDQSAQDQYSSDSGPQTEGKGRPTPKRKVAEAQNLRPLVPKDRKASRKAAKARRRAREDAEYEAMRTGDIYHMPKSERLPWRIYIRDYVDARFNLLELIFPFMIVMLVVMFSVVALPPSVAVKVTTATTIILYVYLIAAIIDIWLAWRRLRVKLIDKFGERSVAKGMKSGSYMWQRAMTVRRWRVPKPRHDKRGHWPE
ncbi:DUF3043 domain-containing protein [Bifidobacterium favimelis]|uniref:DUF3043 domain-containing protein n=1 Tax=Bifidobacterium favimelis TaxID=3122979 RepID=A0ABU8ZMJ0_9BIFI